jgi:hypothetical protein
MQNPRTSTARGMRPARAADTEDLETLLAHRVIRGNRTGGGVLIWIKEPATRILLPGIDWPDPLGTTAPGRGG